MGANPTAKLVMEIITIVVAVLIIAQVALPVIDDAQTEIKTTGQNTDATYHAITPADNGVTLSISSGVVTFGSEVTTLTAYSQILMAENFGISAGPSDNTFVITLDGGYAVPSTITVNSSGITYGEDGSLDYGSYAFIMSSNGDYGIFQAGDTVKFNANTELYLAVDCAASNSGASPTSYVLAAGASGKYNSLTGTFIRNITDSDVTGTITATLNVTEESGYYSCVVGSAAGSLTFKTSGGTVYTGDLGTARIIAPIDYKYISDTDSALSNIIGIIPILLILAPVMMAVRMMALKRN